MSPARPPAVAPSDPCPSPGFPIFMRGSSDPGVMRVSRSDLAAGLRDVVPLLLTELPFGVVVGTAAVVAWRTGSVLWTLVVGMIALYLLRSGLSI